LYGTDYSYVTALGLETHQNGTQKWNSETADLGLAMPQLYAEAALPWGNGLNVKAGHFYSILGYETATSTGNFFYSHSYTRQYGEPLTHTGALATYCLSPNCTVQAGFTRGWNNWEDPNNELGWLLGFSAWTDDGRSTLQFALHSGDEDRAGRNNRTSYSLVYQHFGDCATYVFQHDYGVDQNSAVRGGAATDAHWLSIVQYIYWPLREDIDFGARLEWFNDVHRSRVIQAANDNGRGGDYSAFTMGLNCRPTCWVTVRPELRWDWSDFDVPALGRGGAYDGFTGKSQFTLACDVIAHF
ncbi:MAG: porin, partial [Planctomycetales bacterium]|nr:porin [Planctomycetales bacterium]